MRMLKSKIEAAFRTLKDKSKVAFKAFEEKALNKQTHEKFKEKFLVFENCVSRVNTFSGGAGSVGTVMGILFFKRRARDLEEAKAAERKQIAEALNPSVKAIIDEHEKNAALRHASLIQHFQECKCRICLVKLKSHWPVVWLQITGLLHEFNGFVLPDMGT